MSENYDAKLCEEKNKRIDERLNEHEKRLNVHSNRLDILEQRGAAVDTRIELLCQQLQSLTTTLKWFIGILAGSFIGFFFYAVQTHIFK